MKKLLPVFFAVMCTCALAQESSHTLDSIRAVRMSEMQQLADQFRKVAPKNDSLFVQEHNGSFAFIHAQKGPFPAGEEKEFHKARPGKVIGPYEESGPQVTICKILSKTKMPDSVQVRHILIAYKGAERADPKTSRTKEQAKQLADSLCNVIASGKTKMEDLVMQFTEDPGSRNERLGNYGWYTQHTPFVEPFKQAGFNNPVGKTLVVETQFGYHVIQVLAHSKESDYFLAAFISEEIRQPEVVPDFYASHGAAPEFPGGDRAYTKFLEDYLHYPEKEKADGVEGTVFLSVQIDEKGNVTEVTELAGVPDHPAFTEEAIRLVKLFPRIQPAVDTNGNAVPGTMTILVPFDLQH